MLRLTLGLIGLMLTAAQAQTIVDGTGNGIPKERLDIMLRSVSNQFPDPEASRFRSITSDKNNFTICGEVNSKNLYGAYSGYKLFIESQDNMPLIEASDGGLERDSMLRLSNICKPK